MVTVFKILRDYEKGIITEKEKKEWLDIVLNTDYKE